MKSKSNEGDERGKKHEKSTNIGLHSLTLTWSSSTDNAGVTGYEVYRGSTLLKVVPASSTSMLVTGLSPGASHIFTVKARDAANNKSLASNQLKSQTKSAMTIVGKVVSVNGKALNLGAGVEPVVLKGILMVPFRPVLEGLGLKVSYHATKKIIEGTRTGYNLKLQLNSKTAVVNDKTNKIMPAAPVTIKGVTMVPVRFIGEELGMVVTYRSK